MKKNTLLCLLALIPVVALSSCGKENPIDSDEISTGDITNLDEFDEIKLTDGVEFDYEQAYFDDFTNGVNKEKWYIANQAWGKGNGGVIPQNVFYSDDGKLILRANGNYYAKGEVNGVGDLKDGRNTGAVLISKFTCGPGRYQSRFIPICRQGNCTAMWTYAFKQAGGEAMNHEIDIELPGGSTTGTVSFKKALFTNWITETDKQSTDVLLEEATHGKTIDLNDGKFHTFGFDWYTNPEMVVYHIDGYITAINTGFVPTLEGRLWLGNWFPQQGSFVGVSDFETEYMVVDWFKYIPFKDQPFTPNTPDAGGVATDAQYPTSPISVPNANWVANGDFEYTLKTGTQNQYGWTYSHMAKKPASKENTDAKLVIGDGYLGTVGAQVNGNALLTAKIDSVYEGNKFNLSFNYKSAKNKALNCYITYLDVVGGTISEDKITTDLTESFLKKEYSFTAPVNTFSIKVEFCNDGDSELTNTAIVDNVSLVRQ